MDSSSGASSDREGPQPREQQPSASLERAASVAIELSGIASALHRAGRLEMLVEQIAHVVRKSSDFSLNAEEIRQLFDAAQVGHWVR